MADLALIWLALCVGRVLSVNQESSYPNTLKPHENIKLRLYSNDAKTYDNYSLSDAVGLFYHRRYNTSLPLVMIVHGYGKDQNHLIQQTVDALFGRNLSQWYNILAVDLPRRFSFKIKTLYMSPALHVPSAGEALGELFNRAISDGLVSPGQINLISFSLGAQIAGYIGRSVNGVINSISGIDPAGIGFELSGLMTGLKSVSQADARYVHLYHSDTLLMGSSRHLGTADYLFNGGHSQPGCQGLADPFCDHMRGFLYYHEALREPRGLPAVQCNSLGHLIHCKCQGNRMSFVGFPLDTRAHGVFVLRTMAYPPYTMGKNGVRGYKCKRAKSSYGAMLGHKYDRIVNLV